MNSFTQVCSDIRPDRGYLMRLVLVCFLATVLATLLFMTIGGGKTSDLATEVEFSLVYSFAIGIPMGVSMRYVAIRGVGGTGPIRWLVRVGIGLAITAIGCLVAGLILVAFRAYTLRDQWTVLRSTIGFSAVIALTISTVMWLYESMRSRLEATTLMLRTKQLEEERVRKLAAEARLSSLESRIHPHFLFNTLNSIASLIPEDPQKAEGLVGKLAALLRFSLDANQTSLVPLRQEIKTVRDYLDIEKARFQDRLRYSIDVPAALEAVEIPPLSLQSLVENSVKHAVAPRREGGEIRIAAAASDGHVTLEVADDGPGFSLETIPPGHGLDNLVARLAALFGPAARLEVLERSAHCVVRISL